MSTKLVVTGILTVAAGIGAFTALRKIVHVYRLEKHATKVCSDVLDDADVDEDLPMTYLQNGTFAEGDDHPPVGVFSGMEIPTFNLREHRHRRLPHRRHHRRKYMQGVVMEVKAKVGTPTDTKANRLVIQRQARSIIETHGLRPSHAATILPLIVEAVLTPGSAEIYAHAWASSFEVMARRSYKTSWLSRLCSPSLWGAWIFGSGFPRPPCL